MNDSWIARMRDARLLWKEKSSKLDMSKDVTSFENYCNTQRWSSSLQDLSSKDFHERRKFVVNDMLQAALLCETFKFAFGHDEGKDLRHIISCQGRWIDSGKVVVMKDCAQPETVSKLWGLPNLTGYAYGPTHDLLKNGFSNWNTHAEEAFHTLKEDMMTIAVLAIPNFKEKFMVETDASDGLLGPYCFNKGIRRSTWLKP